MEILLTGVVHTLDPNRPRAEAVLVEGARIKHVGTRAECESLASSKSRAVALGAGCITPGLVDAHRHAALFGRSLEELDLRDLTSEAACVARVKERAKDLPEGTWIRGGGWDQTLWPISKFPHARCALRGSARPSGGPLARRSTSALGERSCTGIMRGRSRHSRSACRPDHSPGWRRARGLPGRRRARS